MIFDAASALRANATPSPRLDGPNPAGRSTARGYISYMIPAREWVATGNGRRV
jgi:hypothetical protein